MVVKTVAALITLLAAGSAFAQVNLQEASGGPVKCADFKKNPDGSWTPVIDIIETGSAGKNRLAANASTIRPGANFSGIDIAAALSKQCH